MSENKASSREVDQELIEPIVTKARTCVLTNLNKPERQDLYSSHVRKA